MIYHPTIIILCSILALIISYRTKKLFAHVALIFPILTAIFLYHLPINNNIEIFNVTIICDGNDYNKLIGAAFILVLFSANLYALGQNKKIELIVGSAYCGAAFICLLAGDFLSMFVGLELMMVFSSILIFIGGMRASLRSAKKYFLVHLISSNLILIGIAYLNAKNNNLAIINIIELLNKAEYFTIILLTGMLINIAIFPFSSWMTNYYPKASPTGFIYLISFTTKVSIMLLIKLFAGCEWLKYIAMIGIIYASLRAIYEDNLLGLLCYLSIMSMGLMLLGISDGSDKAILATISYLFVHIIYKLLLTISVATIIDKTGIDRVSSLQKINCKFILLGLMLGIMMMITVPSTASFYIKSNISSMFKNDIAYFIILFLSFMSVLVIPFNSYFHSKETMNIKLNIQSKYALLAVIVVLLIVTIGGSLLPVISNIETFEIINFISYDSLKQLVIIISALGTSIFLNIRRETPRKLLYVTAKMLSIFAHYYNAFINAKHSDMHQKEDLSVSSLGRQLSLKLAYLHNQQTAIFVVFILFIIMLMVLTINV